jgi:hypothetical protein
MTCQPNPRHLTSRNCVSNCSELCSQNVERSEFLSICTGAAEDDGKLARFTSPAIWMPLAVHSLALALIDPGTIRHYRIAPRGTD